MSLLRNKYLVWSAQIILGFVFIFAAAGKIADPASFAEAIANYKLVPAMFINFFAIIIPWIELVSGILLIFNNFPKENSLIINSLLILFIIMVAVAMLRGLNIDCGCYGTSHAQQVGFQKILENIGLLILGAYIYCFSIPHADSHNEDI